MDDHRALIGQRLGAYRIQSLIGEGAQAAVYLATDEGLGRPAAVKIFRSLSMVPELVNEARLVASLSHRSIVNVYAMDLHARVPFMAMEYAPTTIYSAVRTRGPMPVASAIRFAAHGAAALSHAHVRGVIHRDVKPSNMLLTEGEELRLADFGLARLAAGTHSGRIVGTPHYMAPEVWEGRRADARSDVYSLGACLYFMLVGSVPFAGNTIEVVKNGHLHGVPEFPTTVPGPIRDAILELLAKDPADRPRDAEEVQVRLLRALRSLRHTTVTDARTSETRLSQRVVDSLFLHEPMSSALHAFEQEMLRCPTIVGLSGPQGSLQPLLLREFLRRHPSHCFVAARIRIEGSDLAESLAAELGVLERARPQVFAAIATAIPSPSREVALSVVQVQVRRTLTNTECADLCELATQLEGRRCTLQVACDDATAQRIQTAMALSGEGRIASWVSTSACTLEQAWPIVLEMIDAAPTRAIWALPTKLLLTARVAEATETVPRVFHNVVALAQLLNLPVITSFTVRAAEHIRSYVMALTDIPDDWKHPPPTWPDEATREDLAALDERLRAFASG